MSELTDTPAFHQALDHLTDQSYRLQNELTKEQLTEVIRQIVMTGDLTKLVSIDGRQQIIYLPYAREQELEHRIQALSKALDEAANSFGPDREQRERWQAVLKDNGLFA